MYRGSSTVTSLSGTSTAGLDDGARVKGGGGKGASGDGRAGSSSGAQVPSSSRGSSSSDLQVHLAGAPRSSLCGGVRHDEAAAVTFAGWGMPPGALASDPGGGDAPPDVAGSAQGWRCPSQGGAAEEAGWEASPFLRALQSRGYSAEQVAYYAGEAWQQWYQALCEQYYLVQERLAQEQDYGASDEYAEWYTQYCVAMQHQQALQAAAAEVEVEAAGGEQHQHQAVVCEPTVAVAAPPHPGAAAPAATTEVGAAERGHDNAPQPLAAAAVSVGAALSRLGQGAPADRTTLQQAISAVQRLAQGQQALGRRQAALERDYQARAAALERSFAARVELARGQLERRYGLLLARLSAQVRWV